MAKRSIEYARITEAEAIQVFTSNPRGWAMPETNHETDALFRERAEELDLKVYVHAPFLINLGSPTEGTIRLNVAKRLARWALLSIPALPLMKISLRALGSRYMKA